MPVSEIKVGDWIKWKLDGDIGVIRKTYSVGEGLMEVLIEFIYNGDSDCRYDWHFIHRIKYPASNYKIISEKEAMVWLI